MFEETLSQLYRDMVLWIAGIMALLTFLAIVEIWLKMRETKR